jgi:hypothetical protein
MWWSEMMNNNISLSTLGNMKEKSSSITTENYELEKDSEVNFRNHKSLIPKLGASGKKI